MRVRSVTSNEQRAGAVVPLDLSGQSMGLEEESDAGGDEGGAFDVDAGDGG
jgi:hypothetical protein